MCMNIYIVFLVVVESTQLARQLQQKRTQMEVQQ